jgi:hypothetical protein
VEELLGKFLLEAKSSTDFYRPVTPPLKPFQHPPDTRTHESHQTYLDQRITDHINDLIPLTPSYQIALRSYNEYITRKMTEAKLIEKREVERQQAALEKHKLKLGSSRHIQRGGVIRVGDARSQLTQRDAEEWQKEANKDVVNMAEQRARRQSILEQEKKDRAAAKVLEKEQRATIKAAEREEQGIRKEAVKLAVKELGKAITRAGLRSHSGPGKEAWKALEVYVKHKGDICSREIREGSVIDYNEIDLYVKYRLDFIKIISSWNEHEALVEMRVRFIPRWRARIQREKELKESELWHEID